MRVLVVEDEEIMADALVRGLRRSGYAVDLVTDGGAALDQATINHYDVILLDRDLPVVHGDEVCRTLVREGTPARILMLTAAGTVAEKVDGFALGADDYLPKPFAFAELLARVDALARRTTPAVPPAAQRRRGRHRHRTPHGDPGRTAGPADAEGVRRARRAGARRRRGRLRRGPARAGLGRARRRRSPTPCG